MSGGNKKVTDIKGLNMRLLVRVTKRSSYVINDILHIT